VILFLSLYFPRRSTAVYGSSAAVSCYGIVVALMAPHVLWLADHQFLPFHYAQATTGRPFPVAVLEILRFPLVSALFLAPAIIIYATAAGWNWRRVIVACQQPFAGARASVAMLAFGPLVLTMVICLLRPSTLKLVYATPLFFMVPVWFAMAPVPVSGRLLPRVRKACTAVLAACLAISPFVAGIAFAEIAPFMARPKSEIARAVTDEWHRRFGAPLRIVAGTEEYALAAPFYSRDHPSYLFGFDAKALQDFGMDLGRGPTEAVLIHSPWVSRDRIARQGLAVICSHEPTRMAFGFGCDQEAAFWVGSKGETWQVQVEKSLLGLPLPSYRFQIYFRLPAPLGYQLLPTSMGPHGPFVP
jgi:hypothetical protein